MKAILRCWKICSLDLLPDAIQKDLSIVFLPGTASSGSPLLIIVRFFDDCYNINLLKIYHIFPLLSRWSI